MKVKRQVSDYPNKTKTPEEITYRLVKEYKREKLNIDNKNNWVVWWVVQWCRCKEVVLEKRRVYIRLDGTLETYKQMPWSLKDMQWLAENWTDINETLQRG